MVYGFRSSDNCQVVAISQTQVFGGKQLNVATQHAANVYTACIAELELPKSFAVQLVFCEHDGAAFNIRIDIVPVYLLLVPVASNGLTKQYFYTRHIVFIGNDEQIVVVFQYRSAFLEVLLLRRAKCGK